MSKTKMTVGQAVVKFLNQQYIEFDGVEQPFVDGIFTIFGHGMVVGLGQALDEDPGRLRVYQGRNEQGTCCYLLCEAAQPPQDHRLLFFHRPWRSKHGNCSADRIHQPHSAAAVPV